MVGSRGWILSLDGIARDLLATLAAFALALAWLRTMDALAARGRIEPRLSRKIIHIGTGPLFVLSWLLFSPAPQARLLASLVPLAITVQFLLVASGRIQDPAAVKAMTRTGDRREILRGPLYYGIVFIAFTLVFWRTTPIGPVALMILCAGDGLAGVVGVRRGRTPLPHNPRKTLEGSASMFVGGLLASLAIVLIFQAAGLFVPQIDMGHAVRAIVVISLAATLVESLPLPDVDNLTISLTAAAFGVLLF